MKKDAAAEPNRKEFFNQNASSWDERFIDAELADFLKTLVPKFSLAGGQKVLDLGTGTGVLIPYLVREVGSSGLIVAVDFAEKMVEICKNKYSSLSNVKIELQNVEELDFPNDYFDAVTCFGLFPHIENKQKALSQIGRVLKPGGKLIIAHAISSHELKIHHHNVSSIVANDVMPSEKEMKQLLKNAGFENTNIKDQRGYYLCIAINKRRRSFEP